jgi:hypothetical protein
MVDFVDASVQDLAKSTQFLHLINPKLKDRLVCAIEKAQPMDQSVVFHLIPRNLDPGVERTVDMIETFILSAEYILEHPYWKGKYNDKST